MIHWRRQQEAIIKRTKNKNVLFKYALKIHDRVTLYYKESYQRTHSLWTYIQQCAGQTMVVLLLIIWRTFYAVFSSSCASFQCHQQCTISPSPWPLWYLLPFFLLRKAILKDTTQHLIVLCLSLSPMTMILNIFLISLFHSKIFVCDFCCLENYWFVLSSSIMLTVGTSFILVAFQFWIYESNMNNGIIKYLRVLFCVGFSFGFL